MTFYEDRVLISNLPDEHAASVLELLETGVPHSEAPSAFRAALAAAQRSLDVSRFLLVEKSRKQKAY